MFRVLYPGFSRGMVRVLYPGFSRGMVRVLYPGFSRGMVRVLYPGFSRGMVRVLYPGFSRGMVRVLYPGFSRGMARVLYLGFSRGMVCVLCQDFSRRRGGTDLFWPFINVRETTQCSTTRWSPESRCSCWPRRKSVSTALVSCPSGTLRCWTEKILRTSWSRWVGQAHGHSQWLPQVII